MVYNLKDNSLLLIMLILVLGAGLLPAQDNTVLLDSLQWQAALEKYQYTPFSETDKPEVDLKPLKSWDLSWLNVFFTIFGILLLVVLIVFLFYFYRYRKNTPILHEDKTASYFKSIEENLETTDLDPEINKAIKAGQYDIALRLLYLNTLKLLHLKEIINFQPNTPNGAYVKALQNHNPHDQRFSNLTAWFESVWYGKKSIDRSMFDKLHTRFRNFSHFIDQSQSNDR